MQKQRELSLLIFSISTSFFSLLKKIYTSSNLMAILYLQNIGPNTMECFVHSAVTKSFLYVV